MKQNYFRTTRPFIALAFAALAAPAAAQQVGTFGACMLETSSGEPVNVGACELKPPSCTSASCELVFHWQAGDFTTQITAGSAGGFPSEVSAMNGQTAYQPLALRDTDPRDCIYNEVTDGLFCFLSDVDAHLIAADGLSAYDDLIALAAGDTAMAPAAPQGKKSAGTASDMTALLAPLQGTYRVNPSWTCRDVGSDGGALEIAGNVFYGVESACTLSDGVAVGAHGAALFRAECSGEGETWTDEFILRRDDWGGLGVFRSDSVSLLEACP